MARQGMTNNRRAKQGMPENQRATQGMPDNQTAKQGMTDNQMTRQGMTNNQRAKQRMAYKKEIPKQHMTNNQRAKQGMYDNHRAKQDMSDNQKANQIMSDNQKTKQVSIDKQMAKHGMADKQRVKHEMSGNHRTKQGMFDNQKNNPNTTNKLQMFYNGLGDKLQTIKQSILGSSNEPSSTEKSYTKPITKASLFGTVKSWIDDFTSPVSLLGTFLGGFKTNSQSNLSGSTKTGFTERSKASSNNDKTQNGHRNNKWSTFVSSLRGSKSQSSHKPTGSNRKGQPNVNTGKGRTEPNFKSQMDGKNVSRHAEYNSQSKPVVYLKKENVSSQTSQSNNGVKGKGQFPNPRFKVPWRSLFRKFGRNTRRKYPSNRNTTLKSSNTLISPNKTSSLSESKKYGTNKNNEFDKISGSYGKDIINMITGFFNMKASDIIKFNFDGKQNQPKISSIMADLMKGKIDPLMKFLANIDLDGSGSGEDDDSGSGSGEGSGEIFSFKTSIFLDKNGKFVMDGEKNDKDSMLANILKQLKVAMESKQNPTKLPLNNQVSTRNNGFLSSLFSKWTSKTKTGDQKRKGGFFVPTKGKTTNLLTQKGSSFPRSKGSIYSSRKDKTPSTEKDKYPAFQSKERSIPSTNQAKGSLFPSIKDKSHTFGSKGSNVPSTKDKFPTFGSKGSSIPSTKEKFPTFGSNGKSFTSMKEKFPSFGSKESSIPSTKDNFPTFGSKGSSFPSTKDNFPTFGSKSSSFPSTKDNFPTFGSKGSSVPSTKDKYPTFGSKGSSFPSTKDKYPTFGKKGSIFPSIKSKSPTVGSKGRPFPTSKGQWPNSESQRGHLTSKSTKTTSQFHGFLNPVNKKPQENTMPKNRPTLDFMRRIGDGSQIPGKIRSTPLKKDKSRQYPASQNSFKPTESIAYSQRGFSGSQRGNLKPVSGNELQSKGSSKMTPKSDNNPWSGSGYSMASGSNNPWSKSSSSMASGNKDPWSKSSSSMTPGSKNPWSKSSSSMTSKSNNPWPRSSSSIQSQGNDARGGAGSLMTTKGSSKYPASNSRLSKLYNFSHYGISRSGSQNKIHEQVQQHLNSQFGTQKMPGQTRQYGNSQFDTQKMPGQTRHYGNSQFGFQKMPGQTRQYGNSQFGFQKMPGQTQPYRNSQFGAQKIPGHTQQYGKSQYGSQKTING